MIFLPEQEETNQGILLFLKPALQGINYFFGLSRA
jgi:hypothetical protein